MKSCNFSIFRFFTVIFRKNTCRQTNRSLVLVPYNIFMRFSFPYESIHLGFFLLSLKHTSMHCVHAAVLSVTQKCTQTNYSISKRIIKSNRVQFRNEKTFLRQRQKGQHQQKDGANDLPITNSRFESRIMATCLDFTKWTRAMCKPDTQSYSPHLANYLEQFLTLGFSTTSDL